MMSVQLSELARALPRKEHTCRVFVFCGVRRHWSRWTQGRQSLIAPWNFTAIKPLWTQFTPFRLRDLPAGHITYIRTQEGWLFDLFELLILTFQMLN